MPSSTLSPKPQELEFAGRSTLQLRCFSMSYRPLGSILLFLWNPTLGFCRRLLFVGGRRTLGRGLCRALHRRFGMSMWWKRQSPKLQTAQVLTVFSSSMREFAGSLCGSGLQGLPMLLGFSGDKLGHGDGHARDSLRILWVGYG